jgi:glucose-6-phosphate 1-dehydrogenase
LDEEFGTRGNRLFYLAVAPDYFADVIARLGAHGMAQSGEEADHWVRVVIEKPFGDRHSREGARLAPDKSAQADARPW